MSSATNSLTSRFESFSDLLFKSSFVSETTPIVFVLHEDYSLRKTLERLIRREGWQHETFESAQECLAHPRASVPNCLLLDVSLPELNGLELQKRFAIERPDMSIIFITDRGDIPTAVQAMVAGAIDFLTKPFLDNLILTAIREAWERSSLTLCQEEKVRPLRNCYASLSP